MDEKSFARGSGCQATASTAQWYQMVPSGFKVSGQASLVWNSGGHFQSCIPVTGLLPTRTPTQGTQSAPYTRQVQLQACLWYVFQQRFASTWGFLPLKQNWPTLVIQMSEKSGWSISDAQTEAEHAEPFSCLLW